MTYCLFYATIPDIKNHCVNIQAINCLKSMSLSQIMNISAIPATGLRRQPNHSSRLHTRHHIMPGLILVLLTCISLLQPGAGYSTGAPSEACLTLHPGHGGQSGDDADSPYQLTVSHLHWQDIFSCFISRYHQPV